DVCSSDLVDSSHPHAPADEIPAHAVCDESTQVSRFYYCLRFHVPAATSAPPPPTASAASSRKETPAMNPSNPGSLGNPANPTAGTLVNILQPAALQTLRGAYNDTMMTTALSQALPTQYPAAQQYVDAIRQAFYGAPGPAPL